MKKKDKIEKNEIKNIEENTEGYIEEVKKTLPDTVKMCVALLLVGGALMYFFL